MTANPQYPNVFNPIRIKNLILKNRLQFAPTVMLRCSPEGEVTQEMLDYISFQAKTGVSLITIGSTPVVSGNGTAWLNGLNITTEESIEDIAKLLDIARVNGAELSVELTHAGRGAALGSVGKLLAPSAVALPGRSAEDIKEMNRDDLDYIKRKFVECAVRCSKAGMKIIMLNCGYKDLLGQFLSSTSNIRKDNYGGTAENRRRYPLEILKAVRDAVGEDLILELRSSTIEKDNHKIEFNEALEFLKEAQQWADIIHIARGNVLQYSGTSTSVELVKSEPFYSDFAAEVKKIIDKPVAVIGNIESIDQAEDIISSGKADIVVMARSCRADHDMIQKSLEGNIKEIRPCLHCNTCNYFNENGISMKCAVNPGLEYDMGSIHGNTVGKDKTVMVIGGGPAGMTAAQTLAERGYRVRLFEKSDRLGGLLNDACNMEFKECLKKYLEWSVYMTEKSGAEIIYNTEIDENLVIAENPDAVVVATGSEYLRPDLPGIGCHCVRSLKDILKTPSIAGENVVICGGGISGLECAVMLGKLGRAVTIVDKLPEYMLWSQLPAINKTEIMEQVRCYNITLKSSREIKKFSEYGMVLTEPDGKKHLLKADTYVIVMGLVPRNDLFKRLFKSCSADIYPVGACAESGRNIYNTVHDAFNISRCI